MVRVMLVTLIGALCLILPTHGHEGHHEASTGPPPTNFNDPKITQDQEHLKEHMKDEIKVNPDMSPEEMEFHYFRIHDVNNDTHLDGLEIYAAMAHMMPPPELTLVDKLGKSKEQIEAIVKERQDGMSKYYEDIIDRVFIDDDKDKNGYLTYTEFVRARRRDEYHQRKMHDEQMRQQEMAHQQQQQQQQYQQFQQFQAMQQQQQQKKQPGNQVNMQQNQQQNQQPNQQQNLQQNQQQQQQQPPQTR